MLSCVANGPHTGHIGLAANGQRGLLAALMDFFFPSIGVVLPSVVG
jgi:hypothetical protein